MQWQSRMWNCLPKSCVNNNDEGDEGYRPKKILYIGQPTDFRIEGSYDMLSIDRRIRESVAIQYYDEPETGDNDESTKH